MLTSNIAKQTSNISNPQKTLPTPNPLKALAQNNIVSAVRVAQKLPRPSFGGAKHV
jgi:hypothetical protein